MTRIMHVMSTKTIRVFIAEKAFVALTSTFRLFGKGSIAEYDLKIFKDDFFAFLTKFASP